jgi:heat shock protein HslJ
MSTANSAIKGLTGDWNLSKLGGVDVGSLLPAGAKVPSLNFAQDGKVSGFSGVNRLASSLDLGKLAKGEFSMAPAASTRMAGPPESMKVEDQFLAALGKATGYKLDGNSLSLTDKAGELLKFVRP